MSDTPSQPSMQTGLDQSGNPASKTNKEEQKASEQTENESSEIIDRRKAHDVPSTHDKAATASSLGYGETGTLKEKDIPESDAQNYTKDGNLDGEQMRAPGEGEVAEAVKRGGGGGHAPEPSLTADMDQKKEEHEQALHDRGEKTAAEIEAEEKEDWTNKKADVGEALAGREVKVVLAAEE